jgi:hypothetical protein
MVLAVGSPTLAAYSQALTALNTQWLARRISDISHPKVGNRTNHVFRILCSLQQVPLRITTTDGLYASLIVLPENDGWWSGLADLLNYTRTWSIPAWASIGWVLVAYVFIVIDTFKYPIRPGVSNGPSVGSGWLWLLPVTVGWLRMSHSALLKDAVMHANNTAYVAAPDGDPVRVSSKLKAFMIRTEGDDDDNTSGDEGCGAPIYNFARSLRWSYEIEIAIAGFDSVSTHYQNYDRVDKSDKWKLRVKNGTKNIHDDDRRGSLHEVIAYVPSPDCSRNSNVWRRMFIASLAALFLQWGTAGGAIIIVYFTPTVGLGCHSLTFLLYAAISTMVWILLLISSLLTDALSHPQYRHSPLDQASSPDLRAQSMPLRRVLKTLAVGLRRAGKFFATCNAIGIVLVCTLEFGNVFDTCYCNGSVIGLQGRAYNVITIQASDVKGPWAGGVVLACVSAASFFGFVMFVHQEIVETLV